jgi:hypothetical protein
MVVHICSSYAAGIGRRIVPSSNPSATKKKKRRNRSLNKPKISNKFEVIKSPQQRKSLVLKYEIRKGTIWEKEGDWLRIKGLKSGC